MEKDQALTALLSEFDSLLSILNDASTDLTAAVPTCPGWSLEDLAVHLGRVYSYVSALLSGDPARPPDRESLPKRGIDESAPEWMTTRFEVLVQLLAAASPESAAWNFLEGPAAPARFWWRRQLHETTIHRVDAELASGRRVKEVQPDLAADGVDEFLVISGHCEMAWDDLELGENLSVHLHATDTPAEWTLDSGAKRYARAHMKGDVAVRGTAWELDLWCWGRSDEAGASEPSGLQLFGDVDATRAWRPRL